MNLDPGGRILDPVTRDAVLAALQRGETIQAIKLYRLSTGAGLAQSKRAVEALRDQQGLGPARGTGTMRSDSWVKPALIAFVLALAFVLFARFVHS